MRSGVFQMNYKATIQKLSSPQNIMVSLQVTQPLIIPFVSMYSVKTDKWS